MCNRIMYMRSVYNRVKAPRHSRRHSKIFFLIVFVSLLCILYMKTNLVGKKEKKLFINIMSNIMSNEFTILFYIFFFF